MIEAKIIELDRNRNNVVLSRRAWLEEAQKEQRGDFLTNLKPGERRKGTVSSVVNFGAFVDLGGMDGLVHVSELSWKHVDHPSSVVQVGDEIEVEVLDVDLDKERISLSLKATQTDPWQEFADSHEVGQLVYGRITKLVPFGAFVQVGDGIEGLVHISEMAAHHVDLPEQVVNPGEELWVKIIEIDLQRRRISLSIKQAAEGGEVSEEYREAFGAHAYDAEGNYIGNFDYSEAEFTPETEAQAAWADYAAEHSAADRRAEPRRRTDSRTGRSPHRQPPPRPARRSAESRTGPSGQAAEQPPPTIPAVDVATVADPARLGPSPRTPAGPPKTPTLEDDDAHRSLAPRCRDRAASWSWSSAVLRFWTRSPLWLDEALTVDIARHPLSQLHHLLRQDGAPPLYYVLLHFWMKVFGTSDLGVRSLSGVHLAAHPAGGWWAARTYGRQSAWAVVVLVAGAPFAIYYGTEARMYALVMLLTVLGFVALDPGAQPADPGQPARHRAGDRGAPLQPVLGGVPGRGARRVAVVAGPEGPAGRRCGGPTPGGASGRLWSAASLFAPWLPTFFFQSRHTGTPWAGAGNFGAIVSAITGFTDNQATLSAVGSNQGRLLAILYFVLVFLAVFGVARDRWHIDLDLHTRPRTRAVAFVVFATLVTAVAGGLLTKSGYSNRYASVIFVPFLVLVAMGLMTLREPRVRAVILLVAAAAGLAVAAQNVTTKRTQAGPVAAVLAAHAAPGDLVAYCPDQLGPAVYRLTSTRGYDQITYPRSTGPDLVDWIDYKAAVHAVTPSSFVHSLIDRAGGPHHLAGLGARATRATGPAARRSPPSCSARPATGPRPGSSSGRRPVLRADGPDRSTGSRRRRPRGHPPGRDRAPAPDDGGGALPPRPELGGRLPRRRPVRGGPGGRARRARRGPPVVSRTHPAPAVVFRVHQGLLAWDAGFYESIARFGYRPFGHQALRFFPFFPLAARAPRVAAGRGRHRGRPAGQPRRAHRHGALGGARPARDGRRRAGPAERRGCSRSSPPAFTLVLGYAEGMLLVFTVATFLCIRTATARQGAWWWRPLCSATPPPSPDRSGCCWWSRSRSRAGGAGGRPGRPSGWPWRGRGRRARAGHRHLPLVVGRPSTATSGCRSGSRPRPGTTAA